MKQAHCLIVLLGALTLSACGGGGGGGGGGSGGGGGGGGGGTAATYTIGGAVQGLSMYSSSGVVLQNNHGDNLTVPADGNFTFSEPVSSGAAYDVSVLTQPTGETCTVTSGSSTASSNVTGVSVSCTTSLASNGTPGSNVAPISVGAFPADVTEQVFNVPIVTVTVCDATSKCAPIQVVVDTGSSGLRLIASAVTSAGLTLTPEVDTAHPANTISECAYYADGYAWGSVSTAAKVQIANETATAVPIQVISTSAAPTSCITNSPAGNNDLDSPDSFSADGVLGIGPAAQDCGTACTTSAIYYYSCPAGGCTAGTAASTLAAVSDEVSNPVTLFAKDNNGTLLQLPSIAAGGMATTTGYLAFGVGTQSDNGIGNATVLSLSGTQPQDQQPMYLTTNFNGTSEDGIIDSGSNAYFFADSSLTQCTTPPGGGAGGSVPPFYCPSTTQSLTATNGSNSTVTFQIGNFNTLAASMFYAYNDVGGVAPSVNGTTYFDWGLPFFYGRTVYTIIDGATLGGQTYASGAFAY